MAAMIRTVLPQASQVSMSISKTRLRRCAQLMAARRCPGVLPSGLARRLGLPLPRCAGVTRARHLLFGANTPWNRAC